MIDGETVHSTFLRTEEKKKIFFCFIFLRVHEYLILLIVHERIF